MQHIKNFMLGSPRSPNEIKMAENGVLFLFSESGQEWYESQKLFSDSTIKFAYDTAGAICCISHDISSIWPYNLSVVELPATEANLRVTLGDDWFYKDGKLQQIRDYLAQAEAERDRRMAEITARIDWLEAAQKDGDISAEEETELAALRASRTKLRRLDLSSAPDINWP
ncbi:tail fiber assembly protein [Citrobacter sp. Ce104]|uniref:tail fiber assembly protein n=1 Tax=Citrobacter sp. Ce104 TaxID=2985040 RepID=UPI002575DB1C|nr:tail fiber assembly protein [Citrobacter sp. Ce104]MDM3277900.1 tail fiber assembly protein [Citrobacter sp. Ce104]